MVEASRCPGWEKRHRRRRRSRRARRSASFRASIDPPLRCRLAELPRPHQRQLCHPFPRAAVPHLALSEQVADAAAEAGRHLGRTGRQARAGERERSVLEQDEMLYRPERVAAPHVLARLLPSPAAREGAPSVVRQKSSAVVRVMMKAEVGEDRPVRRAEEPSCYSDLDPSKPPRGSPHGAATSSP